MEFVAAIFASVVNHSIAPIGRQIGYVFHYKSNIEKLKSQVEELAVREKRVQRSVTDATRKREAIEDDVQLWLAKVHNVTEDANKLFVEVQKREQQWCLMRFNLKSRRRLSKKAKHDTRNVDELLGKGKFDGVSYDSPLNRLRIASVKGYEDFESRRNTFDEVMQALTDSNLNMIGVHGMGGVGKTTLVKEVAQKAVLEDLFDTVVIIEVSQNPDIKNIQGIIADKLGLEFREESVPGRADRLCDRLKKEKKILIILDNIWEKLDLYAVGIPFGDDHKFLSREVELHLEKERTSVCKILMTSRDQNVLSSRGMEAQKLFSIGVLSEPEAWDLFMKKVGDTVEKLALQPLAFEVAKKCAGLLIAIVTVACALKDKSLFEWKNALQDLKKPSSRNFFGMQAAVYAALELSYNHLEGEELKLTFLYCGVIGSSHILDLLKYGMGLGLFTNTASVEEARDRLLTSLSNLQASSLLLESSTSDNFSIHDVVRDVAISIASRDHQMILLRNQVGPRDWPSKDCTAISLWSNDIDKLPEQLECPILNFFHMNSKDHSLMVPNNFFHRMIELKVLDLTNMHLLSLPSSIVLLENLRTLCLDQCVLHNLAIIGELKKLEILSLLGSDIESLPKELGYLTQLKLLDLTRCSKLKVIPPGVLSSLSQLEELYMGNSFDQWECEGSHSQQGNASLSELKQLSRLITIDICVRDIRMMPKSLLFVEKLERYRILIGDVWVWFGKYETSRTLKVVELDNKRCHREDAIYKLAKKAEDLHLDKVEGVKYVVCELNKDGFPVLKHLHIQNSPEIQYIVNSSVGLNAFPMLETLCLQNLINLEKICHGELHVESFRNLQSLTLQNLPKLMSFNYNEHSSSTSQSRFIPLFSHKSLFLRLEVLKLSSVGIGKIWPEQLPVVVSSFQNLGNLILEGCNHLEYIFSSSMAKSLVHLKHLEICECEMIQDIILPETNTAEEKKNKMFLPLLAFLKMKDLPKLITFCFEESLELPSLKKLRIENCPKLTTLLSETRNSTQVTSEELSDLNVEQIDTNTEFLFNEKVVLPMLEDVVLLHMNNLKNIWYQLSWGSSCKLKWIQVENCGKLSTVFPATLAKVPLQLETLIVVSCGRVEYIFAKDEKAEATTGTDFLFPRLSTLRLWSLPKLSGLYPGLHTSEWTMLKNLSIYHCDKIKAFTPISQGTQGDQLNNPTQQPFFIVEKVFSTLEGLTLNSEDIEMFNLRGDFPPDLFFKIRQLRLMCFHDVSAVIPLIFLQRFQNLETLNINCSSFQELLPPYEARDGGEEHAVIFTKITRLLLSNLSSFRHIWEKDDPREPVLRKLRSLEVRSCPSLINLAPSLTYLENLTYLDVWKCAKLINVVPSCAGKIMVNLNTLKIRECYKVTSIISNNEGHEAEEGEIVFSNLVHLELDRLPGLLSFCSSNHSFMFPRLVKVVINQCPKIETFEQGVVSTPLLRKVWLTEGMDVGRWEGDLNTTVKEMFAKMDGLRHLEHVSLTDDFPRLVELWHSDAQRVLDFKNLKVLTFDNCSSLRFIFTESMAVNLVQLQHLEVKNCIMMEEILRRGKGDEQAEWNMIKFPRLEILFLESCCQLTCFSSGHNTQLEFPSLKTITVKKCPDMKTFVEAIDDGNVETHQWPFFSEKVLFPVLEEVTISNLENVGNIWPNQLNANAISKLRSIKVEGCSNLSSVFPATLAKSLLQLEELDILSCGVEYIFAKDEKSEATTVTEFLFPKLSYLQLWMLPKLRGLYPGLHTSEWTMLKDLNIYHCDKIQIYAPHPMISQGTKGGNNPTQQPLFNVEKDFSTLEELALNSEDIKMINLHCQFPEELFFKLRTLNVQCFHDLSAVIPLSFLQRFHNLETLIINCSSFRELLPPCEAREGGEEHIVIFTRITKLVLNNLSSLTHLCKEDYPWEHVLQNLEHLQVWKCPSLITLAPSSAYLQNLTYLDVWQCHGLINIMSSSTANSLVNLDTLKIRECDKVAQIISNNEGCETEEEEIIFNKLEYLELDRLSGLLSFCSANNKLTFPCLVEVVINQCPKMETFVQGVVSTPLLDRVMMMDVNCWKGDLNTTVKQNVCKNGLTK